MITISDAFKGATLRANTALLSTFRVLLRDPRKPRGHNREVVAATLTSLLAAAYALVTNYTANGAISLVGGVHTISKTSAAAMTVAAPSNQDGLRMTIIAGTDFAHVITFTGSTLLDGTTGANLTVTLTAFKGSAITIIASGSTWLLESSSNITSIA